MTELTLFVKAYNSNQLKQVDDLLQSQYEDLDIKTTITANTQNKWVQLTLEGEDEAVATAYARKKIGICPVNLDSVEEGQVLKGYISKVDESRGQLIVDVGVYEPKVEMATISLVTLRGQFSAPKEATLGKIAEAYALAEGLPISVKVTDKAEGLKAELSAEHLEKLRGWQQSLLDRLIITRSNRELVDSALERTRLGRDVIDVEQLGFFEFALTCKLGTEARGLVSRLGRYMRYAVFVVFSAKKSSDFLCE
ncbi:DUF2110 family protein [Candidatus Bathyarchaeota archaeon]|nr:DUF2110 family protein [Candidatus Bathyarchaeota archaeon]